MGINNKIALVHKIVVHKFVYYFFYFGSKVILETYNLGSKSNISRIKSALQDKEMIDFDKDTVYLEDPVFKIWYQRSMK